MKSPPLRGLVPSLLLLVVAAILTHAVLEHGQNIHASNDHSFECENHDAKIPSFQWVPQAKHPCTIERIDNQEFLQRFGPRGLPPLFPTPLVIRPGKKSLRNDKFRNLTRLDTIQNFFPVGFNITLSSSNSYSEHRKTIPLLEYLDSLSQRDTSPDQLSNETWYFFGETYSPEWKRLLEEYEIPICHACFDRTMVALSFGIGNRGSGVQWHIHGPGFAETIWGRKHWILLQHHDKPVNFHPDRTSRNWMEYTYPKLPPDQRPFECTLEPGDVLYFPDMWYHATINLDPYTAFVSTFTQEHLFVDS